MIEIQHETVVDAPAAVVRAIAHDYRRDPEWRQGVATMDPQPPGPVAAGQTTAEVLRVAGRTYRNGGVVTAVDGDRFTWRTTSGVDADGARTVEALDGGRCRVVLELRLRPKGLVERLAVPMVRKGLAADLERLAALALREPVDVA